MNLCREGEHSETLKALKKKRRLTTPALRPAECEADLKFTHFCSRAHSESVEAPGDDFQVEFLH